MDKEPDFQPQGIFYTVDYLPELPLVLSGVS